MHILFYSMHYIFVISFDQVLKLLIAYRKPSELEVHK